MRSNLKAKTLFHGNNLKNRILTRQTNRTNLYIWQKENPLIQNTAVISDYKGSERMELHHVFNYRSYITRAYS